MSEHQEGPRRSFGHIYRRGSRFWIQYTVHGTTYRESSGSGDRRKAEKLLARREAELGIPGAFVAPTAQRTRFEDVAQMIRDEYKAMERKSGERLEIALTHLGKVFCGRLVAAITKDRLNEYVAQRKAAGAAAPTIAIELNVLKRALRLGKEAGKVITLPAFPKLAKARAREGFFEHDDFEAVLAELPDALRAPVEFAYLTGWRKSEVLGLTWERIDWEAGQVKLEGRETKTGKGRVFPFAAMPRLKGLLDEQRARTRQVERRTGQILPWVFHRDGQPVRDMFESWNRACTRAAKDQRGVIVRPQLIGRIFHDLRRTAVRNLVRAGVPEHIAMRLTGHKTRAVFDRYDIVSGRDLVEGVEKLAAFHDRKSAAAR